MSPAQVQGKAFQIPEALLESAWNCSKIARSEFLPAALLRCSFCSCMGARLCSKQGTGFLTGGQEGGEDCLGWR